MFPHLIANEPTTVELTKEEYENYRNPRQPGQRVKDAKDEPGAVAKDTGSQTGAPFQGTRAEAIKILQERGFEYKQLRSKKRAELIELI